jgi:phage-related protein
LSYVLLVSTIPIEQIKDSHKLQADALIDLFELTPSGSTGTVRFKSDNDVTWRSHLYQGVPMSLSGEKRTSDAGLSMPKLTIGQENADLSQFKPLAFDGYLDNAVIVKITILLDDLLNDRLIRKLSVYRVKRLEENSRSKLIMQLATLSDSMGFQMPYRQFLPPAFPSVQM